MSFRAGEKHTRWYNVGEKGIPSKPTTRRLGDRADTHELPLLGEVRHPYETTALWDHSPLEGESQKPSDSMRRLMRWGANLIGEGGFA